MQASPDVYLDFDVLVIGGGFAGLWAALRASERGARVALVDKAHVSRSGCSSMSGGVTTAPFDGEDLTPWVREFVHKGDYMADQEWTRQFFEDQRERVKDMDRWGVPISKDARGQIRRFVSRGMVDVRCMQINAKRTLEILRSLVTDRGVTILNRVTIVELLTTDGRYPTHGRVCGAVGFHTRTGELYILRAKCTVLSTGHMNLKGFHKVDNDTGDGVRMGFNVGGRLVDLEFGFSGGFSVIERSFFFGSYNVALAHGAKIVNALGERFMENYDPQRRERTEVGRAMAAALTEILQGRGPIYIDLRDCDESYWTDLKLVKGQRGAGILLSGKVPDPRTMPIAIEPSWALFSATSSGLQIDLCCRTNVPGLFAAGGAAKNTAAGTHSSAGIPTAFCFTSGYRAGEAAALESRELPLPELPRVAVEELRRKVYAPLARKAGVTPDYIHDVLAEIHGSSLEVMVLSDRALTERLRRLDDLREPLAQIHAPDLHELVKAHEAESAWLGSQLLYLSARDRTESREQFYREDYPETNDEEWFCWHVAQLRDRGIAFERDKIPIERYPFQPPKRRTRLGPVAAIMQGLYDPANYD